MQRSHKPMQLAGLRWYSRKEMAGVSCSSPVSGWERTEQASEQPPLREMAESSSCIGCTLVWFVVFSRMVAPLGDHKIKGNHFWGFTADLKFSLAEIYFQMMNWKWELTALKHAYLIVQKVQLVRKKSYVSPELIEKIILKQYATA